MGIITPVGGYIGAKPDFLGARPGVYRLDEHYELIKRLAWPIAIGTPMAGGYYAGTIEYGTEAWLGIGGERYHLIVAPKASGEASSTRQLKTSNTTTGTPLTTSSPRSDWDGYHNTYTSAVGISAVHPASNYCQGLTIGGYSDWYLPSKQEIGFAFSNLAYLTDWLTNGTEEFEVDGSSYNNLGFYWSSTEQTSTTAAGWFTDGAGGFANVVNGFSKTSTFWVRAIRRIPFIP